MKAEVIYFGLIAEKLGKSSEEIDIPKNEATLNLRTFFENLYPDLTGMNYKIAVNQKLTDFLEAEENHIEIALLPPFAGG